LRHKIKGSWDAHAYDQVSCLVQYRWGQQVLEWRKWYGNEIVMDAGCGTGLLTKELAKKVPRGKVYAVDLDSNMIEQARTNLRTFDNVEIVQSSFTDVKLPRKVDVIFSNSAFHWVQDQRKAFQNFWRMLKPTKIKKIDNSIVTNNENNSSTVLSRTNRGGQLLIQCGGYGNLQHIVMLLERVAHSHQFKPYFSGWNQPWHFANPEETDKLLKEAGYIKRKVYSIIDSIVLPNHNVYCKFIKTVVMKSYLEHLSINDDDDILKTLFFDMFLYEIKKYSNNNELDKQWRLDFVRLNIVAHKP
jgi:trans-aconitate 2-methyltransferase